MDIKKLLFAKWVIPSLFVMVSCKAAPSTQGKYGKPNIVIVLADDLGWSDVGYNGSVFHETPNIDRLAKEGMVLNRFYPSAANCAPSRACLLTGMYSPRHGVYVPQGLSRGGDVANMRWKVPTHGQDSTFNTFNVSINDVDSSFESLAEMLHKGGYVSARFGKWHIGDDNQGFDVSSANGELGYNTNAGGSEDRFYSDTTVAEKLTDAAINFMNDNKDGPFFLYLSHWEVHSPMAARKERINHYSDKDSPLKNGYNNPVYAAEVEQLDISLGRIMDALSELGLDENTLLIFTSDNGGSMEQTTNVPLRAGKGTFYEGGIRTPFIVRWPLVIKAGSSSDIPVNGIDLMPTFAELASVPVPGNQAVDGISILPIFKEEEFDSSRAMFFHFPLYLGGQEKSNVLPVYKSNDNYWRAVPLTAIIKGRWKLIYYHEYDRYELFDISSDIAEQNERSVQKPEIVSGLLGELKAWIREVNAPVPSVPNEAFRPNQGTTGLSR